MSHAKSKNKEEIHVQGRIYDQETDGANLGFRFFSYLTRAIGFASPTDKDRSPLLPIINCYCISEAELEVCRRLTEMMRVPHTIVQADSDKQPTCALTPLRHLEMELEFAGGLVIYFGSSPQ